MENAAEFGEQLGEARLTAELTKGRDSQVMKQVFCIYKQIQSRKRRGSVAL